MRTIISSNEERTGKARARCCGLMLLMPISLPELVQKVLELIHRRSVHDLLW